MKKPLFILVILFFLIASSKFSFAQNGMTYEESTRIIPSSPEDDRSAFRSYYELENFNITTPTVVEIDLKTSTSIDKWAVWEAETATFQPTEMVSRKSDISFSIETKDLPEEKLNDKNQSTYVEYAMDPQKDTNSGTIVLFYERPISTSELMFDMPQNAVLPETITIEYLSGSTANQDRQIALYNTKVYGKSVKFPTITSTIFFVTLTYSQPLRINEISFVQDPDSQQTSYFLRFLARPNNTYLIYTDADRSAAHPIAESGNLRSAVDVHSVPLPSPQPNPFYVPSDRDNDVISDQQDNCPSISNPNQEDINNNGTGDACEDFDLDSIINSTDNCPDHPNRLQQDEDSDGYGDHCDPEESRLTERLWWLPWLGIGVGFAIVISLLVITVKHPVSRKQDPKIRRI